MQGSKLLLSLCALVALGVGTRAQACTDNVVKVIVPFSAGTSIDASARVIFNRMGELLSENFAIMNMPGASGEIGAQYMKEAVPDGCTISSVGSSPYTLKAVRASKNSLAYDPRSDMSVIGGTVEITYVLSVNARLPIRSLEDLAAYGRQHPGELRIGTSYSVADATLSLLRVRKGIGVTPIPYRKGDVSSLPDLIGARIEGSITTLGVALPRIRSGELAPVFVIARSRHPELPDTPTAREVGIAELDDLASWHALIGPPKMADEIIARYGDALRRALAEEGTVKALGVFGVRPSPSDPASLTERIERQLKTWVTLTKAGVVTLE